MSIRVDRRYRCVVFSKCVTTKSIKGLATKAMFHGFWYNPAIDVYVYYNVTPAI